MWALGVLRVSKVFYIRRRNIFHVRLHKRWEIKMNEYNKAIQNESTDVKSTEPSVNKGEVYRYNHYTREHCE